MPSLHLLLLVGASAKAVATVGACSGVGMYAYRRGLMANGLQEGLDKLIASVFLPSLILGKVAPNVTPEELVEIWPLVVMCACVVLFGLFSGAVVAKALEAGHPEAFPKYTGLVMVALGFPNSFSVPLTLLLAVGDDPALVQGGAGADLPSKVARLFLMSYSVWVLARWSIGYPILSGAITFRKWREKVLNPPVVSCLLAISFGLVRRALHMDLAPGPLLSILATPVMTVVEYNGRCTVPVILLQLGARLGQAIDEVQERRAKSSGCTFCGRLLIRRTQECPSPTAIEPELVGLASPKLGHPTGVQPDHCEEGLPARPGPEPSLPLVVYPLVLAFRQVIGPAFSAAVAGGLLRKICGVTDPVVLMVAMLQGAGPPMINLSVMAGLSGNAEREASKLLLVTYSFSVVTWAVSISCFLWLLG